MPQLNGSMIFAPWARHSSYPPQLQICDPLKCSRQLVFEYIILVKTGQASCSFQYWLIAEEEEEDSDEEEQNGEESNSDSECESDSAKEKKDSTPKSGPSATKDNSLEGLNNDNNLPDVSNKQEAVPGIRG